jgi:hypothetical protein
MAMTTEELERHLLNDLQTLGDLVASPARAGSWRNLRAEHHRNPLALAQTGGEGERPQHATEPPEWRRQADAEAEENRG